MATPVLQNGDYFIEAGNSNSQHKIFKYITCNSTIKNKLYVTIKRSYTVLQCHYHNLHSSLTRPNFMSLLKFQVKKQFINSNEAFLFEKDVPEKYNSVFSVDRCHHAYESIGW